MGWQCGCGADNGQRAKVCRDCGGERPKRERAALTCPYDGSVLGLQGICQAGKGYPLGVPCPFVCPRCRHPLDWSGGCLSCYGSPTPQDRATWTFPGARHDTHDDEGRPIGDGQHWVKTAEPDRPAMTPEQSGAKARELSQLLGMIGRT